MRHQFKKALIMAAMLCTSYTVVQADTMNLTYDGRKHIYDLPSISLYINNTPIQTTLMPPIQLGDRVLVPAREVFEPMGASVEWKESERKVYVYDGISLLVLEVDKGEAWVNGELKMLDMPPKVINDKLMIPIRFISEQLGYKVVWDGNDRSIAIEKSLPATQPETPETEENSDETLNPIPDQAESWENSLSNISYEPSQNTLILEQQPLFSIEDLHITDLYRERKIIIDLGGDYSAFFSGGTLVSAEGRIKGVSVEHTAGTRFIINTSSVSAVNLYEQEGKIHIQLVKPNEKYEKIVVIDAGHGGSDPGTSGGGILEKDLNIRYATDLYRLLINEPHIKVYMTREEDVKPSLEDRTTLANEIGASLFVSIHNNYVDNTAVSGTETFYFSNPSDPRGEYFAKLVQTNIIQGLQMKDRKAKANNGLYVLRNTTMPSVLIEGGFLSNEYDRMRLTQSDFSPQLAEIIYQSILTYFGTN